MKTLSKILIFTILIISVMVNVCIATRKNDTALRDKLQKAMDELGWNDKAKMDALMEKAITQQPAAN